jgi:hypothetical protein
MSSEFAQNVSNPVFMATSMRSDEVRCVHVLNMSGLVLSSAFSRAAMSSGSELMRDQGLGLPGAGRT